jgi:DNA-binding MarR family transcriptional regulator
VPKSSARAVKISDATLLQLDNQLCFALHSTSRVVIRKYHAALEAVGVTYPQYLVLLVLWEWERTNWPSPNYLALGKRLDFDSGTLTPLLNRMEANGLIKRTTPAHDRRERHIKLTAAGRALKKRLRRVPLTLIENSPVPLAELLDLRNALLRLRNALAEPSEAPP